MTYIPNPAERPASTIPHPALYDRTVHAAQTLFRHMGGLHVYNDDVLDQHGPMLVTPAHRSYFDAVVTGVVVHQATGGRQTHFMAKQEFFRVRTGPLGVLMRAVGAFPVDRSQPLDAETAEHVSALAAQGEVIGIFPEKSRRTESRSDVKRQHIARGAVQLALATGAPMMPLGLAGVQREARGGWGVFTAVCGQPVAVRELGMDFLQADPRSVVRATKTYGDMLYASLRMAQAEAASRREELLDSGSTTPWLLRRLTAAD